MTGRAPVNLWTWASIAKHFGVSPRTAKAWKAKGAPIRKTDKGVYAEAWAVVDWLYEQPDIEQPDRTKNLANQKA